MGRFAAALTGALMLLAGPVRAEGYPEARRIVAIGGPVTEIIYELGEGDRLVARDTTSVFPAAVSALPDVGYMRQLSAEGVLSVGPDLIVARATSGPPETLDILQAASVPVVLISDDFTTESVVARIEQVGAALGVPGKAAALSARVGDDLAQIEAANAALPARKRVMFVLSMTGGRVNAAGRDTGADGIISLAGGRNVLADAFSGYKLLTDEAIIEAAPEIIVMMTRAGDHTTQKEHVLAHPAIAATPAARGGEGGFVEVDGYALGFGPRTAAAARDLHAKLYGAGG
ncbi:heme/hemin ABC transporter substrate-binding protein [Actibacterium sp. D379-3]